MKYKIINTIILIFFVLSFICNVYLFTTKSQVVVDTKIVHDTTIVIKDSIQKHTIIKNSIMHDTIIKTIINKDTVYIPIEIPITYKTYTDKLFNNNIEYDVEINYSGYKAEINDISIESKFKQQDIINVKQKSWKQTFSIGVQFGYGIVLSPYNYTYNSGPYIGIGVQYGWGYTW